MEDKATRNQKIGLLLAAFAALAVLIIILAINLVNSNSASDLVEDVIDHESVAIEETLEFYTSFENRYQLDYSIGRVASAKIFNQLSLVISDTAEEEPLSSDTIYLTATLIENSFIKVPVDSGRAYSFDVDVSDGRTYKAYARTDPTAGDGYCASFLRRTDAPSDFSYLTIGIIDQSTESLDRDATIATLTDWAKSLSGGSEIVLNVNSLK